MEWLVINQSVSALHKTHGNGQQIDSFFYGKQKTLTSPTDIPAISRIMVIWTLFLTLSISGWHISVFPDSPGRLGTLMTTVWHGRLGTIYLWQLPDMRLGTIHLWQLSDMADFIPAIYDNCLIWQTLYHLSMTTIWHGRLYTIYLWQLPGMVDLVPSIYDNYLTW